MKDSLSEALIQLKNSAEGEALLLQFEREMSSLSDRYESEVQNALKETESSLQKYWQKQLQELESKLSFQPITSQEAELTLISELESWKREECPALEREIAEKVQQEIREKLLQKRSVLEDQLDEEVRSLLEEVTEELQTQFKQRLKEQCYEELKDDKEYLLRLGALEKLGKELVGSLKKSIEGQVEEEIVTTRINEVREMAAKEAENENAHVVSQIEKYYLDQIREVEAKIEESYNKMISDDVQARTCLLYTSDAADE